jgi:DNA-binding transcriptional LysR family regulator
MALASACARVRGMEEATKVALLMRGRRGVHPTAAGKTVAEHARVITHQLDRMFGELSEYARGLRGHVRIMGNTAAMTEFLPEALSAFLAAHPSIDIDLEERPSYEIVTSVADGMADMGIVADRVDTGDLETFPFRPDRLVVVTARDHPLAKRRRVRFVDVLDYDFIGLTEGSSLQEYLTANAARTGKRLKYRVRLRSFDAVCRMVECGVGVGVIPGTAAMRCQRAMSIRRIQLTDEWANRLLTICVRKFDDLQPYAKQLVESIRT